MKLFFSLLILFLLLPVSCTIAVMGVRGGPKEFTPVTIQRLTANLDDSDPAPPRHVRIEGFLLRLGAPDAIRDGRDYLFPFVDRESADLAVAEGAYRGSAEGVPLIAEVEARSLPVEAFLRPALGAREPVAIPYVLEGSFRLSTPEPTSAIARIAGVTEGSQVALLDGSMPEISRPEGVVFGSVSLLFLWLGLKLLRSWRRGRERDREAVARYMERHAAQRGGSAPASAGAPAAAAARPSRSWSVPWGKVAGVLIVLGIAGARFGKSMGPAADNVARSVVRSADDVASATRGAGRAASELPSPGDLALEAAGQLPNVKTAVEAVDKAKSGAGEGPPTRPRPTGRVDLTVTVLEATEVYEPMESAELDPSAPGVLLYELTKIKSVEKLDGKISGRPRVQRTQTSRDLPDREEGEFTRISLQPTDGGVRMTQTLCFAEKDGYMEIAHAAGDMQFVGGGDWAALLAGEGPLLLEFTEEGTAEYARMVEGLMARATEIAMERQGMGGLSFEARYDQPPIQELSFEKGKLTLRQRGKSILALSGR